ncbi:MAG: hypothetical protein IPO40_05580 [Fibrobacteres bacterium]|nr:hypothetical protein [Fibrobacterota bacterium]
MNKSNLDENRSIALIPNPVTAIYPILSIGLSILFFRLVDFYGFRRASGYGVLIAVIALIALGFAPILLTPYRLYSARKEFILKKPFGRIEVIAKSEVTSVDKFWRISGLYNTHTFGRNFYNNKKIVKFIKRHMNK